ncbi:MAG: iron-containing alcohol dehydrogenase [Oscillospiraceae bacterium]|jgi:alcohol dehydrogenase|nr:iron-containing alcohol dehydrogenase [Oscillospiraceae bacterium]
MNWNFCLPVQVLFGAGARSELPNLLRSRRAVLVHAKSAPPPPGNFAGLFAGVQPNPTRQNVADCAAFLQKMRAEVVVAAGGGSVLDCAKAAANGLPLVALPTTAGTGSEVTAISVISDAAGRKTPVVNPQFYPEAAIVDPELTLTCPAKLTAESGMDALSHALEAQWSLGRNPASTALADRAIALVFANLETAYHAPQNLAARTAMSEASLLAGMAFSQARTAGVHACSFPLTTRYGLSHGAACAFTLAAFALLNFKDKDYAQDLARKINRLNEALGLPRTLAQAGIPLADLPALALECLLPANAKNNPVPMNEAMVQNLFEQLA